MKALERLGLAHNAVNVELNDLIRTCCGKELDLDDRRAPEDDPARIQVREAFTAATPFFERKKVERAAEGVSGVLPTG